MKANKFLIAFALCVGFSSSITIAMQSSQTPPQGYLSSLGSWITQKVSNFWQGTKKQASYAGTQLTRAKNYTIQIPQQVINQVKQWSTAKQITVFGALATSLIGLGIYNKDTILDHVGKLADQAKQSAMDAVAKVGTVGGVTTVGRVGVVGVGGAILLNNQQNRKALDAELLKTNFSEASINTAFEEAYQNSSKNILKTVLSDRYNDPNGSTEIRYNIKQSLQDNTYGNGLPSPVNDLKREIELEIIGTGKLDRNLLKRKK